MVVIIFYTTPTTVFIKDISCFWVFTYGGRTKKHLFQTYFNFCPIICAYNVSIYGTVEAKKGPAPRKSSVVSMYTDELSQEF